MRTVGSQDSFSDPERMRSLSVPAGDGLFGRPLAHDGWPADRHESSLSQPLDTGRGGETLNGIRAVGRRRDPVRSFRSEGCRLTLAEVVACGATIRTAARHLPQIEEFSCGDLRFRLALSVRHRYVDGEVLRIEWLAACQTAFRAVADYCWSALLRPAVDDLMLAVLGLDHESGEAVDG